jgi:hypothetical protein
MTESPYAEFFKTLTPSAPPAGEGYYVHTSPIRLRFMISIPLNPP